MHRHLRQARCAGFSFVQRWAVSFNACLVNNGDAAACPLVVFCIFATACFHLGLRLQTQVGARTGSTPSIRLVGAGAWGRSHAARALYFWYPFKRASGALLLDNAIAFHAYRREVD